MKSSRRLILWLVFAVTIIIMAIAFFSIDNAAAGSSEISFLGLTIKTTVAKVALIGLAMVFAFYMFSGSLKLEDRILDITVADGNTHKIFVTVHETNNKTDFIEGATVKLLLKPEPIIKETDKNGSVTFFFNRNMDNQKSIINAEKENYESLKGQNIILKNEEQYLIPLRLLKSSKLLIQTKRETTTKSSVEQLIEVLEQGARNGDNLSIIRYGLGLSRTLWIEGEYDLRLRLGSLIEDAASKLNDVETQSSVLIDDLGWTLVSLKKYSEAEQKIRHGKKLAESRGDFYLACKALRHIAGIHIQRNQYDDAIKTLNEVMESAKKIQDENRRDEMVAGTTYGLAWAFSEDKNFDEAEKHCFVAKTMFEKLSDHERLVKTFSLLGKIFERKDINVAKDFYRQGLAMANQLKRKDEIINNHLGLYRIYKTEGNISKSSEHHDAATRLQNEE